MTPGEKVGATPAQGVLCTSLACVLPVMAVLAAAKRSLHAWSAGMEPEKAPEHRHCPPRDGVRNTWS